MIIDLHSSDPLQNGQEWTVANPKNGCKTTGQGRVHLQYASAQGQNFAQNGSEKPFCTCLEASYSVKNCNGGREREREIYIYICILSLFLGVAMKGL